MGQGIHTALRQICANELNLPPERIEVIVDTERELDTGETTASRATLLGGQAVLQAAHALRNALHTCTWEELVGREFEGEHVVNWTTETSADRPYPRTHIAYGWATQVVTLDDNGAIERVVAAQDVGRVINRQILEGQVEGGVHMGLGYALSEEYELEAGQPVAGKLKQLNIVPVGGTPRVNVILIEEHQPEGPHGAKGAGEAVLVPTAAAVAGALYAYDGVRRRSLPMRDSPAARAAVPRLSAKQ
jgi:xanthine dehydrogenase molybdenum-binding subunit